MQARHKNDYSQLAPLIPAPPLEDVKREQWVPAISHLTGIWVAGYRSGTVTADIVETQVCDFSYLFDIEAGRLIAAWGFADGRQVDPRDKARIAGHPKAPDHRYHRGHAIAHLLGGPADINIVPQLASVNIGRFRRLERAAYENPGSLYFAHWLYEGDGPIPIGVDQGLLIVGRAPVIEQHGN